MLNSIGFKTTLKLLATPVYFQAMGDQSTRAQIGISGWTQDYPHPLDWFDILLNGEHITSTHNNNYANADVPAINRKIDELKREPTLTPRVNREWAALDREVMKQAFWAPLVNRVGEDFFGPDIDTSCYVPHAVYGFVWGSICKKQ